MYISLEHLDALQELLNIGDGRAAESLDQMLGKPIRLQFPFIQSGKFEDLSQEVQK